MNTLQVALVSGDDVTHDLFVDAIFVGKNYYLISSFSH